MNDTNNHHAYKELKKYQLAIRLSILVASVFALLTLAHLNGNISNIVMMSSVSACSVISLLYVLKTKNYKVPFYIISASGVILPSLSIIYLHELTHFTEWIWICSSILLAFLGTNYIYGFFLVIVAIVSSTIFVHYGVNANINTMTSRTPFQLFALNVEFLGAFGCGGYLLYLFNDFYSRSESALIDINENLVEKNIQITQQDNEKTVLVKEIHHRVKNNLQIITSLLRMQSNELVSEEAKKHFNEAINRIMAMSLIHQKLYQENSLAQIELKNYLDQLIHELIDIYNLGDKVQQNVNVEIKEIGLKSIVPIGLLLNELVSNSLEHGFEKIEKGQINILVKEDLNEILMSYSDNGNWKETINPCKPSFGLELIDLLTEQLEGSKECSKDNTGTNYQFKFKNLDQ